jgi:hypothetical protein
MSFLGISAGGNAHHAIEALMALGASALTGLDDIAPKNAKKMVEEALLASRQGEVRVLNKNPNTFSASYNFAQQWRLENVERRFTP